MRKQLLIVLAIELLLVIGLGEVVHVDRQERARAFMEWHQHPSSETRHASSTVSTHAEVLAALEHSARQAKSAFVLFACICSLSWRDDDTKGAFWCHFHAKGVSFTWRITPPVATEPNVMSTFVFLSDCKLFGARMFLS